GVRSESTRSRWCRRRGRAVLNWPAFPCRGHIMIQINEATTLQDGDVDERFVRAFGPGGQNPRKEATAVELRVDLEAAALPADVKERLRLLAGRRVTADGVLVIVS